MKRKVLTILAYTILVVVVLLASTCEGSVDITTPERDAQRLEMMARTVRTEAELRDVERLATKYEIAYDRAMGGATALRFKALVEPILIEAGNRRDAVRDEEDYLLSVESSVHSSLDDMERAWNMELPGIEHSRREVADIEADIAAQEATIATMDADKEALAMEIIEQGYPENLLTELGEKDEAIKVKRAEVEALRHEIEVIELAYRLQHDMTLIEPQPSEVEPQEVTEGPSVDVESLF